MTRDIFVKVATTALRQNPGRSPEEQAEAIALLMDTVASVLGDAPAPVHQPSAPPPPAFPRFNPEAIAPVQPEPVAEPSLIIPATRIPDHVEPVVPAAPPVRSLRPSGRMKVEDLSQLIQERTPNHLTFDVPMGDGTNQRVTFARNVISMHAFDSVQLIYFPPGVTMSARESAEVQAVISIDDLPVDLSAILKKLTEQASQSIRPRGPVMSVAPPATSGPVTHSSDNYDDPGLKALTDQTRAVFNSMG